MEEPKQEQPDKLSPILINTIRQIAHNTRYHTDTRIKILNNAKAEINTCLEMIQYEQVRLQEENQLTFFDTK